MAVDAFGGLRILGNDYTLEIALRYPPIPMEHIFLIRRITMKSLLRTFAIAALFCATVWSQAEPLQAQVFWIAGYGPGVYASRLQRDGSMAEPKLVAEQKNPSFLALHPKLDVMYVVTETMRDDRDAPAAIVAYRFDREAYLDGKTPELVKMQSEKVNGDVPCHVAIDPTGKFAVVANYVSGSVSVFPLGDDGSLQRESGTIQHRGSGPNAERQKGPNAHCSLFDATGRWVLVADLGADRVFVYELDKDKKTLKPGPNPAFELPPGSGPRHLAFHPSGKTVYIINELGMTLTAAAWDGATGKLETISHESTVPEGKPTPGGSTAEVIVHPSGRFVYGSNRGHNTIAIFAINQSTGGIKRIDNFDTLGKTPRNFRIDPFGQLLLAENQDSDTVYSFRIDSATGMVKPTGYSIRPLKPACIKFLMEPQTSLR